MFKETTKKIHFLPYTKRMVNMVGKSDTPVASVTTKYNRIAWGKHALAAMGMQGKFVKLYFVPDKKVIGWRITDKLTDTELKSKAWKLCKPSPQNGTWFWTIKKMLDQMKLKEGASYTNLEIQKYREMGLTDEYVGKVFYFIELKEKANDS